ncbi:hypothetical protein ACFLZR_00200 [Candidatus Neomarinimicrobiota bacterium]
MTLRQTTLAVLVSLTYLFLVRLVATLLPVTTQSLLFTRLNAFLSLLAALMPVAFFIRFLRDIAQGESARLQLVTWGAIISSILIALLFLKGPVTAFQWPILSGFFQSSIFNAGGPVFVWISATILWIFFISLRQEPTVVSIPMLWNACWLASLGAGIGVALRTFLLFVFLTKGDLRWISDLPSGVQRAMVPLEGVSFLSFVYFYIVFYKSNLKSKMAR